MIKGCNYLKMSYSRVMKQGEWAYPPMAQDIHHVEGLDKVKWKKKKAIVKKLVSLAINGDIHAIMGIIEMKDGKPKQGLQLEGEIGIRPIVYKPSKLKVK